MIDVYSGDGAIDWKQVYDAGHHFAFVRCSQGTSLIDRRFVTNIHESMDNGVKPIPYHFMTSADRKGQMSAITHALDLANLDDCKLLAIDIEPENSGLDELETHQLIDYIANLDGFIRYGLRINPIIYGPTDFLDKLGDAFGGHSLWLAQTTTIDENDEPLRSAPIRLPVGWSHWDFWQYTFNGTVLGVPSVGNTDLNIFNGSEADLGDMFKNGYQLR